MTYSIGKIKEERTMVALPGDLVTKPIISTTQSLDLNIYNDITSIENWYDYGDVLCTDILQTRDRIKSMVDNITWTNLTSSERDLVIDLYLKETNVNENTYNTYKVGHLMSKGYTLDQSRYLLFQAYGDFHVREVKACEKRCRSEKLYKVIAKYLTLADAGDLIKVTHKLFDLYKSQAIRGTLDGNAGEGLFNFLESTPGSSYEFAGLAQQGYTLNTGSYDDFITELMDILRHGNY
jgi:hypothetical protein